MRVGLFGCGHDGGVITVRPATQIAGLSRDK